MAAREIPKRRQIRLSFTIGKEDVAAPDDAVQALKAALKKVSRVLNKKDAVDENPNKAPGKFDISALPREEQTGEQPEEAKDADDDFMGAEHFEGHGNAWSALLGENELIAAMLPAIIAEGKPVSVYNASNSESQMNVLLLLYPAENSVRAGALLGTSAENKNWEVYSAYPILEGKPSSLTINKAHTWSNGVEGIVAAHMADGGAPVSFFAPFYLRDFAGLPPGINKIVNLGALAFSLRKAEPNEFTVHQGAFYEERLQAFLEENPEKNKADFTPPAVSFRGAKILLPSKYSAEWKFSCPVLAIEKVLRVFT
jgi:hypothetical protein